MFVPVRSSPLLLQVSAGTCVVLAETLLSNSVLEAVILQDNPLGALGVQKLLKAVHEGGHAVLCCAVMCCSWAVAVLCCAGLPIDLRDSLEFGTAC